VNLRTKASLSFDNGLKPANVEDGSHPQRRHGIPKRSEENEDFLDVAFNVLDLLADDVEADSLGKRSALANSADITDLDTESGRAMSGDGLVSLLESVVLLDVMKVIASDDDGSAHFSGDNDTPNQKRKNAVSMMI